MRDRNELPPFPTDGYGIPLPIDPRLPVGADYEGKTKHHSFYYSDDPFYSTPMGAAVRITRQQQVFDVAHRLAHDAFAGPVQPVAPADALALICLNLAHYVPSRAVNVAMDVPEVVDLSPEKRALIREQIGTEYELRPRATKPREQVRDYVTTYVMDALVHEVPEILDTVTAIANSGKERKRHRAARRLAEDAMEVACEPVRPIYKSARRKGGIAPNQPMRPDEIIRDVMAPAGEAEQLSQHIVEWCEDRTAVLWQQQHAQVDQP